MRDRIYHLSFYLDPSLLIPIFELIDLRPAAALLGFASFVSHLD